MFSHEIKQKLWAHIGQHCHSFRATKDWNAQFSEIFQEQVTSILAFYEYNDWMKFAVHVIILAVAQFQCFKVGSNGEGISALKLF